jgi:hypothetical protein
MHMTTKAQKIEAAKAAEAAAKQAETEAQAALANATDDATKAAAQAALDAAKSAEAAATAQEAEAEAEPEEPAPPATISNEVYDGAAADIVKGDKTLEYCVSGIAEFFKLDKATVEAEIQKRIHELMGAAKVSDPADEQVLANVPRAFNVQIRAGEILAFKAGVQWLERRIAEHWHAKNCGVTLVPERPAAPAAAK